MTPEEVAAMIADIRGATATLRSLREKWGHVVGVERFDMPEEKRTEMIIAILELEKEFEHE